MKNEISPGQFIYILGCVIAITTLCIVIIAPVLFILNALLLHFIGKGIPPWGYAIAAFILELGVTWRILPKEQKKS